MAWLGNNKHAQFCKPVKDTSVGTDNMNSRAMQKVDNLHTILDDCPFQQIQTHHSHTPLTRGKSQTRKRNLLIRLLNNHFRRNTRMLHRHLVPAPIGSPEIDGTTLLLSRMYRVHKTPPQILILDRNIRVPVAPPVPDPTSHQRRNPINNGNITSRNNKALKSFGGPVSALDSSDRSTDRRAPSSSGVLFALWVIFFEREAVPPSSLVHHESAAGVGCVWLFIVVE